MTNNAVMMVKIRNRFLVNGVHTRYRTINELVPVSSTHMVDIAAGVILKNSEAMLTYRILSTTHNAPGRARPNTLIKKFPSTRA